MSKQIIQFNQQEIWCILQALRFVETKDMIERMKLHTTFEQLKLVSYSNDFKSRPNLDLTDLPADPINFEVDDAVIDYVYTAMSTTSVKGRFEASLCIHGICMKLQPLVPAKAEPPKKP